MGIVGVIGVGVVGGTVARTICYSDSYGDSYNESYSDAHIYADAMERQKKRRLLRLEEIEQAERELSLLLEQDVAGFVEREGLGVEVRAESLDAYVTSALDARYRKDMAEQTKEIKAELAVIDELLERIDKVRAGE